MCSAAFNARQEVNLAISLQRFEKGVLVNQPVDSHRRLVELFTDARIPGFESSQQVAIVDGDDVRLPNTCGEREDVVRKADAGHAASISCVLRSLRELEEETAADQAR